MGESEQMGRCRQQLEAWYANNSSSVPRYSWMVADAIDRLAADVAEVMEMTREIALRVPSEFGQDACDVAVMVALKERDAAIRERDEARAEVERLKAARDAPQPAGHGISPKAADTQPTENAAPAAGWLTERERHVLSSMLSERPCDSSLHWTDDVQPVFRSILARAGSPPVVEVPAMVFGGGSYQMEKRYRAAMDRAGVQWKEVPRE